MRKWILVVLGVLGAVGAVISTEFGLTIQLGAVVAGLGAILIYVFGEAKNDIARFGVQKDKWKDPKFWISVLGAIIAGLGSAGVVLPIPSELIVGVLAGIVGILFKTGASDQTQ